MAPHVVSEGRYGRFAELFEDSGSWHDSGNVIVIFMEAVASNTSVIDSNPVVFGSLTHNLICSP